jgi:hypothetical protein
MIDEGRSQIGQCNCVERGWLLTLAFVAVAIAAWLTAPIAQIESIAFAAEVDAAPQHRSASPTLSKGLSRRSSASGLGSRE